MKQTLTLVLCSQPLKASLCLVLKQQLQSLVSIFCVQQSLPAESLSTITNLFPNSLTFILSKILSTGAEETIMCELQSHVVFFYLQSFIPASAEPLLRLGFERIGRLKCKDGLNLQTSKVGWFALVGSTLHAYLADSHGEEIHLRKLNELCEWDTSKQRQRHIAIQSRHCICYYLNTQSDRGCKFKTHRKACRDKEETKCEWHVVFVIPHFDWSSEQFSCYYFCFTAIQQDNEVLVLVEKGRWEDG